MIRASIQVNMLRLQEKWDDLLFAGGVPAMATAAVDDALDELRQVAVRDLSAEFTCRPSEIDQRVRRSKAERENRRESGGAVYLISSRIPLRRFRTRQTPRGVLVSKYRSGSGTLIRDAFGPEIPRLGRGVFKRQGRRRLPIVRQKGVNLNEDKVAAATMRRVQSKGPAILLKHAEIHKNRLLDAQYNRGVRLYGYQYISRRRSTSVTERRVSF